MLSLCCTAQERLRKVMGESAASSPVEGGKQAAAAVSSKAAAAALPAAGAGPGSVQPASSLADLELSADGELLAEEAAAAVSSPLSESMGRRGSLFALNADEFDTDDEFFDAMSDVVGFCWGSGEGRKQGGVVWCWRLTSVPLDD